MTRLGNRERFTDDHGDTWEFHTVLTDGGLELQVTAPGLEPRTLRPATSSPRPRRDAEEPLPLENL